MSYIPRSLNDCHSIDDLKEIARHRLPAPIFNFLEGGAETETTARRNVSAFDEVKLIPRCLVDVTSVKTSVRIFNQKLDWPVLCAPTGVSRFFHPEGELPVARATAAAGTLYGLSIDATCSLEQVSAARRSPKMFQPYVFKDRSIVGELVERCKRSGYESLCLAVDAPVVGKS